MARAKHERLSREAAVDRAFRTRLRIGSVSVVSSDAGLLDWMDCAGGKGRGGVMKYKEWLLIETKRYFAYLTDDERLEVMSDYCESCGCNDPRCQCWNYE